MNALRLTFICFAVLSLPAFAAGSGVQLITITQTSPLSFGKFAASSAGSLTISPAGIRTTTSGIYLLSSPAGSPASFLVTGKRNTSYIITLPSSVLLSNGANTMTIQNLISQPSGIGSLPKGSEQLAVGGTLNVSAYQPSGSYSGVLPVTVNYQ